MKIPGLGLTGGALVLALALSTVPGLPTAAVADEGNGWKDVSFKPIDSGTHSGVGDSFQIAVTSKEKWEALWKEHRPGEEVPAVDFDSESVLAVFLGQRPTSGYSAEILSVRAKDASVRVGWREVAPGPNCIVLMVVTVPFTIVRIPVPGAEADFRGELDVVDCE